MMQMTMGQSGSGQPGLDHQQARGGIVHLDLPAKIDCL
jgi:hypothetical protein